MKTFTLPDAQVIMARLLRVLDSPKLREYYGAIARFEGITFAPHTVSKMFSLSALLMVPVCPDLVTLAPAFISKWIDVLVDDKEFAKLAKEYQKEFYGNLLDQLERMLRNPTEDERTLEEFMTEIQRSEEAEHARDD